jgi:hypothetical protein
VAAGGTASRLERITRDDLERRYGYFLEFLRERGALDLRSAACQRVTPENVDRYIEWVRPGWASVPLARSVYKLRRMTSILYFVSGRGQMWRRSHNHEEIVDVEPGVAITIPVGNPLQFRPSSPEPLTAVGMTMPPGPGDGEAFAVAGIWEPTV